MKQITITVIFLICIILHGEDGYVYNGDLNGDGIADKIESGPSWTFGTGGGSFVVTINGKTNQQSYAIGGKPYFALEKIPTGNMRLWSYWHMSAQEGVLTSYMFTPELKQENITINPGDGGTDLGNAIMKAVFNEKDLIKLKKVKDYTIPPNPSGLEWGK